MKNRIVFACLSDVGRVRTNNEDACGAFPKAGVWCVADGMGGGDDGEVASAETVRAVASFAEGPEVGGLDTAAVVAGVRAAVSGASRRLFDRTREKGLSGCGSTFVGLVLGRKPGERAHALHAGDSRLYRIRNGAVRRITRDHSFAEAAGVRAERELNPMFRSVILRAVGVERDVTLDDTPFELLPGDRVILCSDGLSRMVSDAELAPLTARLPPEGAAHALIEAANAAGGEDNVTAVVVDVAPVRRRAARVLVVLLLLLLSGVALLLLHSGSSRHALVGASADTGEDSLLKAARQMEREADARMNAANAEFNAR